MINVKCPVCSSPAKLDSEQENTIYCESSDCSFIGIVERGSMTGMTTRRRYTVRKQSSGYASSETFYVYDTQRKGRVSVHASITREGAQADADQANIIDAIADYADDPRPFSIRLAEAEAAFYVPARSVVEG